MNDLYTFEESVNDIKLDIYDAEYNDKISKDERDYLLELCNDLILETETTSNNIETIVTYGDSKSSKNDVDNIQSTFSKKERKMMGLDTKDDDNEKEKVIARFVTKVDNTPVAYFSLQDVGIHINASVGTKNDDKYRGKGYATKCIKDGLDWYKKNAYKFKNKPVVWWASKENIASQKTAEKAGFKKDLSIEKSDDEWLKNNWFKYVYK